MHPLREVEIFPLTNQIKLTVVGVNGDEEEEEEAGFATTAYKSCEIRTYALLDMTRSEGKGSADRISESQCHNQDIFVDTFVKRSHHGPYFIFEILLKEPRTG